MSRYRYRLDAWDVLLLVVGLVIGVGVGLRLGASASAAAAVGVGAGVSAMTIRRKVSPNQVELVYGERPKQVSLAVLPMLLVGIGGLVSLVGVISLVGVGAAVADESDRGLSADYLLIPIAICAAGLGMMVSGINWASRLTDREKRTASSAKSHQSGSDER